MRASVVALRRRPGRSAATVFGIGLATGLVLLLLALSAGVQTSATTLANASGIDLLATSSGGSSSFGAAPPPIPHAHRLAQEIPAKDPNVAVASPWLVDNLVYGNATLWARANASTVPGGWGTTQAGTVGWIPSDTQGIEIPPITAGTGFTYPGDPYYNNGSYNGTPTHQLVIDQALAGVLGVSVGEQLWAAPAGPTSGLPAWYENATEFTVVGVSGPFWLVPSALLAFGYLSEIQSLVGAASPTTDYATFILIHLHDPSSPATDQVRIARAFSQLSVLTLSDILREFQHVVDVYRTFGTLVGSVGIVVAALFTTTILQMSVDDRSRELALLRAIGSPRAEVGWTVLEEGLVLSGLGLAVGLPLAYLGALAMNAFLVGLLPGLPAGFSFVSFDPTVIVTGAAAVVGIGLVAGTAPAVRAMGLPIAEELRAP